MRRVNLEEVKGIDYDWLMYSLNLELKDLEFAVVYFYDEELLDRLKDVTVAHRPYLIWDGEKYVKDSKGYSSKYLGVVIDFWEKDEIYLALKYKDGSKDFVRCDVGRRGVRKRRCKVKLRPEEVRNRYRRYVKEFSGSELRRYRDLIVRL